jgi:hypothetical protein
VVDTYSNKPENRFGKMAIGGCIGLRIVYLLELGIDTVPDFV